MQFLSHHAPIIKDVKNNVYIYAKISSMDFRIIWFSKVILLNIIKLLTMQWYRLYNWISNDTMYAYTHNIDIYTTINPLRTFSSCFSAIQIKTTATSFNDVKLMIPYYSGIKRVHYRVDPTFNRITIG